MAKIVPRVCNGKLLIGTSVLKAAVTADLCIYKMHTATFLYLVLFVHLFLKCRTSSAGAWETKHQQKTAQRHCPQSLFFVYLQKLWEEKKKQRNIVNLCPFFFFLTLFFVVILFLKFSFRCKYGIVPQSSVTSFNFSDNRPEPTALCTTLRMNHPLFSLSHPMQ